MRRYSVLLEGRGNHIRIREWESDPELSKVRPVGFYTTRFVTAASPSQAGDEAKAMVALELKFQLVEVPEGLTIQVVEIHEDPPGFERFALGSGFSWFTEIDESDVVH